VVRYRRPVVGYVVRPLIWMRGLPPGADSVSRAGPLPSTTYGTGSIATSATSSTDANIDRSRTTVRRCRAPRSGPEAGGGSAGTASNGEAANGKAPYAGEASGEAPSREGSAREGAWDGAPSGEESSDGSP